MSWSRHLGELRAESKIAMWGGVYHAFCICRGSEWEAIDLMDVVVHVFSAEQRDKYNLDEYYSQAEVFAGSNVFITLVEISLQIAEVFGWSCSASRAHSYDSRFNCLQACAIL